MLKPGLVALATLCVVPAVAHARFGDGDTTYGRGGVAPIKVPSIGFPAPERTAPLAVRINGDATTDVVVPTGDGVRTVLGQARYDAAFARTGLVRAPFGVSGFQPSRSVRSGAGFVTLGATYTARGEQPTIVRTTATGALDPTFGRGGVVRLAPANLELNGSRIATGPGGTVVVAVMVRVAGAQFASVRLTRLRSNGAVDTTFGTGGVVSVPFRTMDPAMVDAVAVGSDGRVVVSMTGYYAMGGNLTAILRFRVNGTRDTTFDGDGVAQAPPASVETQTQDLVVQPDGKVTVLANDYTAPYPLMYRLGANGRVDTTFGESNSRTVLLAAGVMLARPVALARRTDGRYVAVGVSSAPQPRLIFLSRVDGNGKNGTTVNLAGTDAVIPVELDVTASQVVIAAANQTTGTTGLARVDDANTTGAGVVVAVDAAGGTTQRSAHFSSQVVPGAGGGALVASHFLTGSEMRMASLTATGAMDQQFGPIAARGGVSIQDLAPNGYVSSVRRLPDGRIVLTTAGGSAGGQVVMLTSAGAFDTSFAGSGDGVFGFGATTYAAGDVVRLPDGKLLVGYGRNTGTGWRLGFLRLGADGLLDLNFTGDGSVELPFPAGFDSNSLPPGALHVHAGPGGYVAVAGSSRTLVARVSTAGVPDPTLGGGSGIAPVGPAMRVEDATVDRLGRTVVVGSASSRGVVMRLTTALRLDTTFSGDGVMTYTPPRGIAQLRGVATLPDRSLLVNAIDLPPAGGIPTGVYLMVSSRGALVGRAPAFGSTFDGRLVPTADGRFVVGGMPDNVGYGKQEGILRRLKGIAPAAPLSARRTTGRTFRVRVDARGLTRTTVWIQALRSGRWRTIGSKVAPVRVGYRTVQLSTSRRASDRTYRAVVINASGRTNGRSFRG